MKASARCVPLAHQYGLTGLSVRTDQVEGTLFRHAIGPIGFVPAGIFLLLRKDHLQADNLVPGIAHRHQKRT
ncbi:hypothetical protein D3C85_1831840 [compost metagenome]